MVLSSNMEFQVRAKNQAKGKGHGVCRQSFKEAKSISCSQALCRRGAPTFILSRGGIGSFDSQAPSSNVVCTNMNVIFKAEGGRGCQSKERVVDF